MQKELKFQSQLTCKKENTNLIFKSNEVKVIVLPKPKIIECKPSLKCDASCNAKRSNECLPNLIYYFLFSKLI